MKHVKLAALAGALFTAAASAQPISAPASPTAPAEFDIVRTDVMSVGPDIRFRIAVRGEAGTLKPKAVGQFAGSAVYSYV